MSHSNFEASRTANGAAANTDSYVRTNATDQLYFSNYTALTAVAYHTYPDLLVFDADKIMTMLGQRLARYKGPANNEAFLRWASEFVRKEADRYKITLRIMTRYRRVIDAAIRRYRQTSAAYERYVEHDDVFIEVMTLVFQRAHSLNKKGPAKISTRLTALVKKHCYFYHVSKCNTRHRVMTLAPTMLGVETLSKAELASQRFDRAEAKRESRYDGTR